MALYTCSNVPNAVALRVTDGRLAPLPTAEIASSYDPQWSAHLTPIPANDPRCALTALGPALPYNPAQKRNAIPDAVLAAYDDESPKFTTTTPSLNNASLTVAAAQCHLSNIPGENTMVTWHTTNNPAMDGYKADCTYIMSELTTPTQLLTLQSKTDAVTFDNLMTTLVSLTSTTCPPNPTTGARQGACSTLHSATPVGAFARIWYGGVAPGIQDAVISNICANNPNLPECECVTRSSDSDYSKMKMLQGFSDACWYTPCANSTSYLVPNAFNNPTCPSNICQIVSNFIDNNNVTLSGNSNVLSCTQIAPPGTPATPVAAPAAETAPVAAPAATSITLSPNTVYFALGVAAMCIILVVILLL